MHSADKLLNKLGFHVMLVIYSHYSFISKDKIQPLDTCANEQNIHFEALCAHVHNKSVSQ